MRSYIKLTLLARDAITDGILAIKAPSTRKRFRMKTHIIHGVLASRTHKRRFRSPKTEIFENALPIVQNDSKTPAYRFRLDGKNEDFPKQWHPTASVELAFLRWLNRQAIAFPNR